MKKFKDKKHKEKIIDRIQKILTVANNTNFEEEAKTAMRMAKGLMKSYGLNMSEVEMKEEISNNIGIEITKPTGKIPHWEKILGLAIAKLCDTRLIIETLGFTKRRFSLMFIGFTDDVKLSITLYNIFKTQMKSLAFKAYKTNRSLKTSFLLGMSDCLFDRAEIETKEAVTDTPKYGALVVVKEHEINKYIKDNFGKLNKKPPMKFNIDPIAYEEGYQEGNLIDLQNKQKLK